MTSNNLLTHEDFERFQGNFFSDLNLSEEKQRYEKVIAVSAKWRYRIVAFKPLHWFSKHNLIFCRLQIITGLKRFHMFAWAFWNGNSHEMFKSRYFRVSPSQRIAFESSRFSSLLRIYSTNIDSFVIDSLRLPLTFLAFYLLSVIRKQ